MLKLSLLQVGFRGVQVALHVIYGIALSCFFRFITRDKQRSIQQQWSRDLLDILRVKISAKGNFSPADLHGRILVANHVSWLDVIALNAVEPACFVAKNELRGWPVLGWLCYRVGTLFIDRSLRRDTKRINHNIASALNLGECIAIFPEGTSTDAGLPGHFHSSLLQGAVDNNSAICPVAIRYHDNRGHTNNDAAFVGEMNFLQSLWKILCSPELNATLFYLPPLPCEGKNRRLLASMVHGSIHMTLANFSPNHSVFVPNAAVFPEYMCHQFVKSP